MLSNQEIARAVLDLQTPLTIVQHRAINHAKMCNNVERALRSSRAERRQKMPPLPRKPLLAFPEDPPQEKFYEDCQHVATSYLTVAENRRNRAEYKELAEELARSLMPHLKQRVMLTPRTRQRILEDAKKVRA